MVLLLVARKISARNVLQYFSFSCYLFLIKIFIGKKPMLRKSRTADSNLRRARGFSSTVPDRTPDASRQFSTRERKNNHCKECDVSHCYAIDLFSLYVLFSHFRPHDFNLGGTAILRVIFIELCRRVRVKFLRLAFVHV